MDSVDFDIDSLPELDENGNEVIDLDSLPELTDKGFNAPPSNDWTKGDGGPSVHVMAMTNEWGGNLRNEGRPVLVRTDDEGKISGYSTTSSTVAPLVDGRYAVIPTVVDGMQLTDDEALDRYEKTGEHWGVAADEDSAKAMAESVHMKHESMNRSKWNDYLHENWDNVSDSIRNADGMDKAHEAWLRGKEFEKARADYEARKQEGPVGVAESVKFSDADAFGFRPEGDFANESDPYAAYDGNSRAAFRNMLDRTAAEGVMPMFMKERFEKLAEDPDENPRSLFGRAFSAVNRFRKLIDEDGAVAAEFGRMPGEKFEEWADRVGGLGSMKPGKGEDEESFAMRKTRTESDLRKFYEDVAPEVTEKMKSATGWSIDLNKFYDTHAMETASLKDWAKTPFRSVGKGVYKGGNSIARMFGSMLGGHSTRRFGESYGTREQNMKKYGPRGWLQETADTIIDIADANDEWIDTKFKTNFEGSPIFNFVNDSAQVVTQFGVLGPAPMVALIGNDAYEASYTRARQLGMSHTEAVGRASASELVNGVGAALLVVGPWSKWIGDLSAKNGPNIGKLIANEQTRSFSGISRAYAEMMAKGYIGSTVAASAVMGGQGVANKVLENSMEGRPELEGAGDAWAEGMVTGAAFGIIGGLSNFIANGKAADSYVADRVKGLIYNRVDRMEPTGKKRNKTSDGAARKDFLVDPADVKYNQSGLRSMAIMFPDGWRHVFSEMQKSRSSSAKEFIGNRSKAVVDWMKDRCGLPKSISNEEFADILNATRKACGGDVNTFINDCYAKANEAKATREKVGGWAEGASSPMAEAEGTVRGGPLDGEELDNAKVSTINEGNGRMSSELSANGVKPERFKPDVGRDGTVQFSRSVFQYTDATGKVRKETTETMLDSGHGIAVVKNADGTFTVRLVLDETVPPYTASTEAEALAIADSMVLIGQGKAAKQAVIDSVKQELPGLQVDSFPSVADFKEAVKTGKVTGIQFADIENLPDNATSVTTPDGAVIVFDNTTNLGNVGQVVEAAVQELATRTEPKVTATAEETPAEPVVPVDRKAASVETTDDDLPPPDIESTEDVGISEDAPSETPANAPQSAPAETKPVAKAKPSEAQEEAHAKPVAKSEPAAQKPANGTLKKGEKVKYKWGSLQGVGEFFGYDEGKPVVKTPEGRMFICEPDDVSSVSASKPAAASKAEPPKAEPPKEEPVEKTAAEKDRDRKRAQAESAKGLWLPDWAKPAKRGRQKKGVASQASLIPSSKRTADILKFLSQKISMPSDLSYLIERAESALKTGLSKADRDTVEKAIEKAKAMHKSMIDRQRREIGLRVNDGRPKDRKLQAKYGLSEGGHRETSLLGMWANNGGKLIDMPAVETDAQGRFVGFLGGDGADGLNNIFEGLNADERNGLMDLVFGHHNLSKAKGKLDEETYSYINNWLEGRMGSEVENREGRYESIGDAINDFLGEYNAFSEWIEKGAKSDEELQQEYEEGLKEEERKRQEAERKQESEAYTDEYYLDELAARGAADLQYANAKAFVEKGAMPGDIAILRPSSLAKAADGDIVRMDHHEQFFVFKNYDAKNGILTVEDPFMDTRPVFKVGEDGSIKEVANDGRTETGAVDNRNADAQGPRAGGSREGAEGGEAGVRRGLPSQGVRGGAGRLAGILGRSVRGEKLSSEEGAELQNAIKEGRPVSFVMSFPHGGHDEFAWPITATKISSHEDAANLCRILSNTNREKTKVIYLDKDGNILDHRVTAVGMPGSTDIGYDALLSNIPKGTYGVVVSHNHPDQQGSDVHGSPKDVSGTKEIRNKLQLKGVRLLDHIVTDHYAYESMLDKHPSVISSDAKSFWDGINGNGAKVEKPADKLNLVPMGERIDVSPDTNPNLNDHMNRLFDIVRSGNVEDSFIVGVNEEANITYLRQIPRDITEESAKNFFAANSSARNFYVYFGSKPFDRAALVKGMNSALWDGGNKKPKILTTFSLAVPNMTKGTLGARAFGRNMLPDGIVFKKPIENVTAKREGSFESTPTPADMADPKVYKAVTNDPDLLQSAVTKALGDAGVLESPVRHLFTGSAADYDKPSLHAIGTGEGAQVYGWGLYASGIRGIAERYAKNSAEEKSVGYKVTIGGVGGDDVRKEYKDIQSKIRKLRRSGDLSSVEELKTAREEIQGKLAVYESFEDRSHVDESEVDRYIDFFRRLANSFVGKGKFYRIYNHAADYLEKNRNDVILEKKEPHEYIYEQTFFTNRAEGDESHLLDWYEPVSKENEKRIVDQMIKEGLYEPNNEHKAPAFKTGEDAYEFLAGRLGSPKAASKFLVRADIDGVKYPADSYGGKAVKDGDEAGWNYVSFRDNNINIDHKWRDDEQLFSPERRAFGEAPEDIGGQNAIDYAEPIPGKYRKVLAEAIADELEADDMSEDDLKAVMSSGEQLLDFVKGKLKSDAKAYDFLARHGIESMTYPEDLQMIGHLGFSFKDGKGIVDGNVTDKALSIKEAHREFDRINFSYAMQGDIFSLQNLKNKWVGPRGDGIIYNILKRLKASSGSAISDQELMDLAADCWDGRCTQQKDRKGRTVYRGRIGLQQIILGDTDPAIMSVIDEIRKGAVSTILYNQARWRFYDRIKNAAKKENLTLDAFIEDGEGGSTRKADTYSEDDGFFAANKERRTSDAEAVDMLNTIVDDPSIPEFFRYYLSTLLGSYRTVQGPVEGRSARGLTTNWDNFEGAAFDRRNQNSLNVEREANANTARVMNVPPGVLRWELGKVYGALRSLWKRKRDGSLVRNSGEGLLDNDIIYREDGNYTDEQRLEMIPKTRIFKGEEIPNFMYQVAEAFIRNGWDAKSTAAKLETTDKQVKEYRRRISKEYGIRFSPKTKVAGQWYHQGELIDIPPDETRSAQRLTELGTKVVERLFKEGKSDTEVANLIGLPEFQVRAMRADWNGKRREALPGRTVTDVNEAIQDEFDFGLSEPEKKKRRFVKAAAETERLGEELKEAREEAWDIITEINDDIKELYDGIHRQEDLLDPTAVSLFYNDGITSAILNGRVAIDEETEGRILDVAETIRDLVGRINQSSAEAGSLALRGRFSHGGDARKAGPSEPVDTGATDALAQVAATPAQEGPVRAPKALPKRTGEQPVTPGGVHYGLEPGEYAEAVRLMKEGMDYGQITEALGKPSDAIPEVRYDLDRYINSKAYKKQQEEQRKVDAAAKVKEAWQRQMSDFEKRYGATVTGSTSTNSKYGEVSFESPSRKAFGDGNTIFGENDKLELRIAEREYRSIINGEQGHKQIGARVFKEGVARAGDFAGLASIAGRVAASAKQGNPQGDESLRDTQKALLDELSDRAGIRESSVGGFIRRRFGLIRPRDFLGGYADVWRIGGNVIKARNIYFNESLNGIADRFDELIISNSVFGPDTAQEVLAYVPPADSESPAVIVTRQKFFKHDIGITPKKASEILDSYMKRLGFKKVEADIGEYTYVGRGMRVYDVGVFNGKIVNFFVSNGEPKIYDPQIELLDDNPDPYTPEFNSPRRRAFGEDPNQMNLDLGEEAEGPAEAPVNPYEGRKYAEKEAERKAAKGLVPAFDIPVTKTMKAVEGIQDSLRSVKDFERRVGIDSKDDSAYYAADRRNGLVEHQMRKLEHDFIIPIFKAISDGNLDLKTLDRLLVAEHAAERNRVVGMKNGNQGASMTDEEAEAFINAMKADGSYDRYHGAAELVWGMNRRSLDYAHDSGRIPDDLYTGLSTEYERYVPLRFDRQNDELDTFNRSIGGYRRNEYTGAEGHTDAEDSPLAWSIVQAEQAIIQANDNIVRRKVLENFRQAARNGFDAGEIMKGIKLKRGWDFRGKHEALVVDENFNQENRDDLIFVKDKGELLAIRVNKGAHGEGLRYARAITGKNMPRLGPVMRAVRSYTRFKAQMRTSLVPTFIWRNWRKDHFETATHLMQDFGVAKGMSVFGDMLKAENTLIDGLSAYFKSGKLSDGYLKEAVENGILIGGGVASQFADEVRRIQSTVRMYSRKGYNPIRLVDTLTSGVRILNEVAENMTRVGVYTALRRNEVSVNDAVSYARDNTGNFNRKGTLTPYTNSFYMFSNAAIQGWERDIRGWVNAKRKGNLASVSAALAAVGVMAAVLAYFFGDDDERTQKGLPNASNDTEYAKRTEVSVPAGGGRKAILTGMRGGPAVPVYVARRLTEGMLGSAFGRKNDAEEWNRIAKDIATALPDEFAGVFGGSASTDQAMAAQSASPTLVDPFVQMATGKDYKGADIFARKTSDYAPDSYNGKASTPEAFKWIAKAVNDITGGNAYRSGGVDLAPETYRFWLEDALGGLSADAVKLYSAGEAAADIAKGRKPKDGTMRSIPFAGDVVRDYPSVSSSYWDSRRAFGEDQYEYKSTDDNGRIGELSASRPSLVGEMDRKGRERVVVDELNAAHDDLRRQIADPNSGLSDNQRKAMQRKVLEIEALVDGIVRGKLKGPTLQEFASSNLGVAMDLRKRGVDDLKRDLDKIEKLRRSAAPGTAQYEELSERVEEISRRISELRSEVNNRALMRD